MIHKSPWNPLLYLIKTSKCKSENHFNEIMSCLRCYWCFLYWRNILRRCDAMGVTSRSLQLARCSLLTAKMFAFPLVLLTRRKKLHLGLQLCEYLNLSNDIAWFTSFNVSRTIIDLFGVEVTYIFHVACKKFFILLTKIYSQNSISTSRFCK